jgi:hypothetical protein
LVIAFGPEIRTPFFMGFCVFVASGLNFEVDAYLKSSPFKARSVFRKGEIPAQENPERQSRPDSGFVVLISSEQGQSLSAQAKTAMKFLAKHEKELDRLKLRGVDNMLFDFGVELGDEIQHVEYLPPELLVEMARFKMGLVFSAIRIPRG